MALPDTATDNADFEARRHVLVRRIKATYPPDYRPRALQAMKRAYRRLKADTRSLLGIDEASAAALYYLEKAGFRTALSRAIWAAYERSRELGVDSSAHWPESLAGASD